jgi:hypothetical protein
MLRASLLSLTVLAGLANRADADILVIHGSIQGGGMFGDGISGTQKGEDFFKNAPNGAYGATVGARFIFFAAEITHRQYAFVGGEAEDSLRTWTHFALGVDFDVSLGDTQQKQKREGPFLSISAMAGFGLGTGQQVDPPLDNSEVTDKGFTLGGKFAFGKHLGKNLDFGLMVPAHYHYMFKTLGAVNDVNNHYQGFAIEALLFLRVYIKII